MKNILTYLDRCADGTGKSGDEVFEKGNGTTYSITQLKTEEKKVELGIDIRYATRHHVDSWDGESGFLPGNISRFGQQGEMCTKDDCLLEKLVKRYPISTRNTQSR